MITILIGVLNGLDLLEFDRHRLMTHVHAGTLGWLTLAVFAFTLWLFPSAAQAITRGSALFALAAIPVFLVGFWIENNALTAAAGTAVLLAVLGFTISAVRAYRASPRTAPRLATAAALVTLTFGSSLGAVIAVQHAADAHFLSSDAIGAHAGAQVVGYLILMGMALVEWRLLGEEPLTRPARAQIALLFTGGLMTTIGALLSSEALLGLFIPLEVAALIIFLFRVAPQLRRIRWLQGGPDRHFGLIVPWLVANVILLAVLIGLFVSGTYANEEFIPQWLIFAFDHAMFIGVMTNGILGMGMLLAADRRQALSWVDHVAFWGINGGVVGFVVGLIVQSAALKRVFTPVMGTSILLALLAAWVRLGAPAREPAVDEP